ncbi:MAG: ABC transporter permease, partial [Spirochaetia bacterium]
SAQDFSSIFFTAFAFIMILYMTVLLYGQGIGRSVLQEKTQKTVEILLSSVKPNHLLMGKILGMTAAGLLQYAVWISMAGIALTLAQPIFGVSVPIQLSYVNLIWLLVFFVLGFLVFASAYAALGAASQDEQNLGQLSWPIMLFLIIPIVMSSGIIMNPESTVAIGMSLFPLTAPIIMFARILVGAPAVWEIALSIGLLAATAFGISYLSAKIFRVGLLMSGKKTSIQEVVKWLSFKA